MMVSIFSSTMLESFARYEHSIFKFNFKYLTSQNIKPDDSRPLKQQLKDTVDNNYFGTLNVTNTIE